MDEPSRRIIFRRPRYVPCDGWIPVRDAFHTALKVFRSERRAQEALVATILNGSLNASTRCVMTDFDFGRVPTTTPRRKALPMNAIWFSSEGQNIRLPVLGLPQVSRDRAISIDFNNSILVCVYPPPGIMVIDPDDGETTVCPGRRQVYYKLEVEERGLKTLLSSTKPSRAASSRLSDTDPESDTYRVNLSKSEWAALLAPLTELAERGQLSDEFGVLGYGDKQRIKDHILEILRSAGRSASSATLLRKCNELINLNSKAIQGRSHSGSDDQT